MLALAALALPAVYARPLTQTVTVGGGGDRAATLGFHGPERNDAGLPFRWTRDQSTVIFRGAGLAFPANRPPVLELTLAGSRPAPTPPARVALAANGVAVGERVVAGETRARLPLEAAFPGPVDARVTLRANTFTPPGDPRALGVAVLGDARLTEEAGDGIALPPPGAWWRWLLTVLCGYGVALGVLRRPALAALAGGLLLLALAGAATLDRPLFWQLIHLPLLGLALALPLLWWRALGRAAAGLVAMAGRRGLRPPALAALGLLPAAAAQALLSVDAGPLPALGLAPGVAARVPPVALALYAVGIAVVLAALGAGGALDEATAARPAPPPPGRGALAALAGILVLAAGARLAALTEIPFGLWRDEARHGLEALRILREPGYRPVYIPDISLPGLYPALLAGAFRLFGADVATLRGFTGMAGVAAVAALWAVTRRLWGPRVALVAAVLLAAGSWRVSIDRLAFATAPTTLCTLLAFYCFLRGADAVRAGGRGLAPFAGAGLAAGLAVYGYYPGRFAAVVLAGGAALLLLRGGRGVARRALPGLALAAAVGALALLPLALRGGVSRRLLPALRAGLPPVRAVPGGADEAGGGRAQHRQAPGDVQLAGRAERAPSRTRLAAARRCDRARLRARAGGRPRRGRAGPLRCGLRARLAGDHAAAERRRDRCAERGARAGRRARRLPAGGARSGRALAPLGRRGRPPRAARRAARGAAGAALALALALNLWLYFLRLPGDPRVLDKFYVGETRAGYAIAAAHARDPALVALLPPAVLRDRNAADVLGFAAGAAPLRELPPDGGALPAGPLLLVVPRGEDRAAFARDLAAARGVAAAAGLREAAGEAPPGGDEPTYVTFARD